MENKLILFLLKKKIGVFLEGVVYFLIIHNCSACVMFMVFTFFEAFTVHLNVEGTLDFNYKSLSSIQL